MRVTSPTAPGPDHAAHDGAAVAALAARDPDVTAEERQTAQDLVAACADCARLHDDLVALAAALPAAGTPRRTRDFTLSSADAERARRRGVRAWLRRIGSSRDTITRPLALGLTTLGLAGLLVATAPGIAPLGSGGGGAAASPETGTTIGAAAPSQEPLHMSPEASRVDDGGVFTGSDKQDPSPGASAGSGGSTAVLEANVADDETGLSTLAVIGGFLLLAGLSLFALRWTSRRLD